MGLFTWISDKLTRKQHLDPEPTVQPSGEIPQVISRMEAFAAAFGVKSGRDARYDDFELMDSGDIAALLDAVCDAALMFDDNDGNGTESDRPFGFKVQVKSSRQRKVVDQILVQSRLKEKLWYYVRDCLKYGDCFIEPLVDGRELVGLQSYHPRSMLVQTDTRNRLRTGSDPDFPGQVLPYQQRNDKSEIVASWEPWQMLHFKWMPSDQYAYSAKSLLDDMRPDWKKLTSLETSMVVARVVRAYTRNVHYLDVTGLGDKEAQKMLADYVRRTSFSLRRQQDKVAAPDEEMFVTTSYLKDPDGKHLPRLNKIDTIDPNAAGLAKIEDIEYQRRKLFSRVPAEILGIQSRNPKAISAQDVAFGRLIRFTQARGEELVRDVIDTGLILAGYDLGSVVYELYWPRNTIGANWLHADAAFRQSMAFRNWVELGMPRREAQKRAWGKTDQEVTDSFAVWKKELTDLGPLDPGTKMAKAGAGSNSTESIVDPEADDMLDAEVA